MSAVRTTYVHPPIPERSDDWQATFDDDEGQGLCGRGATEADALRDLCNQMRDQMDDQRHEIKQLRRQREDLARGGAVHVGRGG